MRNRALSVFALLLAVSGSSACELFGFLDSGRPPLERDPRYRVIDIAAGDEGDGVNISENYRGSRPHDVNEGGEVVGRIRQGDNFWGFYFSEEEGLVLVEPFSNDGPSPEAALMTIQDDGTAWGFASGHVSASTSTPLSWTLGGAKQPVHDETEDGEPWASNDTAVVGGCFFNIRPCDVSARDVYFLDAHQDGSIGEGSARGINDDGDIVGWASIDTSATTRAMRPLMWRAGDDAPTDLGSLTGDLEADGQPYAVNNDGTVIGYSNTDDGSVGFIWTEATGMTPTEALDPGNINIRLLALNNDGVMVGGNWDEHAVIVEDGVLENLNRYIAEDSGWWLEIAYAINDAGWIAGHGTLDDEPHLFLLAPLEE